VRKRPRLSYSCHNSADAALGWEPGVPGARFVRAGVEAATRIIDGMGRNIRFIVVLVGALALAAVSLPGQSTQSPAQLSQPNAQGPPQQPPPTFRVEVNYVEIDAVVTDAQGRFVDDLKKEDFQVIEEGKAQAITAFTRVDIPIERADPPLFKPTAVEPDVRSNLEPFNGRVLLIVLDDLNTDFRRTPLVQAAARQFIRRFVGANDVVAVVTTGGSTRAAQEFTSSRPRLIAAVDKFMGRKTLRAASDMERGYFARSTYATLASLAEYLGPIRGRRKSIVWFGEGLDYDIGNPFAARDADTVRSAMQDTIAAANRANVSFYGVDARGIGAGLDEAIDITGIPDDTNNMSAMMNEVRRAQDSLRVVSTETGGFAIVNQNDLNGAFGRIIQDNSSYYVLGYYASNEKRDGRFRNVQIRLTRPGLTVRSRRGYVAPRGNKPSAVNSALEAQMPAAIRDALSSPIPVSDLGLRMFAAPFTGPAPKASVALVLEIDPARLKFVEKDGMFNEQFDVHVLAMDSNSKMQDGGPQTVPLRLSPPNHDAVSQNGFRLTRRLTVPPGRYQLRVAVRETNGGAIGTLTYDLDVPDFSKSQLQMSGIAVASAWAVRIPTANSDPGLKDVLPGPPTAIREFPRNDTLALFAEVYDNQTSPAHRVAITTKVLADDGRVVFTAQDERSSSDLQGKTGGYGYTLNLPLLQLAAPGRYVLRIEARTLLSNGGTAARELEFRIR
jgi:VWFA-related protein